MKRFFFVLPLVALALLLAAVTHGATEITLDEVDGIFCGDTVFTGNPLRFIFRWTYTPGDGSHVLHFANAIRVWTHQNGAYTDNFDPATQGTLTVTPPWKDMYEGLHFSSFGVDGIRVDTLAFGGWGVVGIFLPDGFDQQAWWIATTPTGEGDTLCLDSCSYIESWGGDSWVWPSWAGTIVPDWSGPHCFHVAECCVGSRGNVDFDEDDNVNIADLAELVGYLFLSSPPPRCSEEANVDGDVGEQINIADLTYLVDYLFRGGPEPPPCP